VTPHDAEPTELLLDDLEEVPEGHVGAWCPVCKVVTVYELSDAD
jgi:hypothetical protein